MTITKYYVSTIVQNDYDKRAWLCPIINPVLSLEDALLELEKFRKLHMVISAWVDQVCENGTRMVFHECYIDWLGNIRKDR